MRETLSAMVFIDKVSKEQNICSTFRVLINDLRFWKLKKKRVTEKDDYAKAGNCLQTNISWLVTAELCYLRAIEDKVLVS